MTAAAGAPAAESPLRRHAVWACVALAYVLVFPYFERLNNPNENVRVWTTRAIVVHGTVALEPVEREWGEVSDRAIWGGRHLSSKAPGTSLLGVPVLYAETKLFHLFGAEPSKRATTWALRVFTVALPLAFFFLMFARAVEREAGPAARDLLVLGLGLGTMLYPYGLAFVGHAQSAALLFGAYLCLRRRTRGWLALAGALAGLAVVFEYQAFFAVAALAVFAAVKERRRAGWFFLGALGPAVLLATYHTATLGRPWSTPLGHLDDPVFREYHSQGFLYALGAPRLTVLYRSLFGLDYGLFVFSPFLAAGLVVAAVGLRQRRGDDILIVAILIVMALFLAGMANWRGGWCAGGPRYIAVVVPFLAWALALSWRRLLEPRWWAGAGVSGLVVASVFLCTLAGAHFPHYPLQLDNPVFDLTLPLLGDGFAPYGLGWLLGLRGLASYLPLAIVVIAASVLALRARGRRGALAAVAVAAVLLGALGAGGRHTFDEDHAVSFVRGVWEPGRSHGPL